MNLFEAFAIVAVARVRGLPAEKTGIQSEQTDATGMQYLRARYYYDPGMGVFTAKDPFRGHNGVAMSMNGYSYVHGNPINYTDPSWQ